MCCCPLTFFLSAKSDKGCYIVTDLLLVYLLQMEKGEVQPKIKNVYRSIYEIYLKKINLIRMLKKAFYRSFESNTTFDLLILFGRIHLSNGIPCILFSTKLNITRDIYGNWNL